MSNQDWLLEVNRNDHAPIAEELIQRHVVDGQAPVFSRGSWWQWNGRHWDVLREQTLRRDLAHINRWAQWRDGKPIATSSHFFSSVINIAESLAFEPDFFESPSQGVAFRDSFVRLGQRGELLVEPNTHEHRARWSYDFDWDASAQCPQWMKFLGEVWSRPAPSPDDQSPPPEDAPEKIACLAQFVGACLTGTAHLGQRAIILVGVGGNGKSVLCDAVRDIFPANTVVSVPPGDLRTPERVARLDGANLNVVSDIPQRGLTDTGLLKQCIAGDITDARRLYKDSFSFRPVCGSLFSANGIPATDDYSTGFQRRWIIMDFPNSFMASKMRRTTDELRALFAAERPGIVRWALEGVSKLMAFREYIIPESSAEAVRRWRMSNDQIACFMDEMVESNDNWGCHTRELFRAYERWAKESGHKPMAMRTFSERLANLGADFRRIGSTGRQWRLHLKLPGQRGAE